MNHTFHIDAWVQWKNPHHIAAQWRNMSYRIKWKISSIIAEEHGKKSLREGTKERLHKEILLDLERIATEKHTLEQYDIEDLREVLKWVSRQEHLWKNNTTSKSEWYNRDIITHLMQIPTSESEIFFLREFLSDIMKIKKETLDNILLNPKYR